MIDWNTYRREFPHLPEVVYLNHAGIAPQNLRAWRAVQQLFEKRLKTDVEFWPAAMEKRDALKKNIGRLINGEPGNIALAFNTSHGINILSQGLDWRAGDRVLLNNFEFPSNVIPFRNLRERGVEIDFVAHRDGRILLEDIRAAIRPGTRVLSISFVEFLNGFRNDLKAIGQLCREHDIIFSVDAIQGLGALQLDVQETGIDFLASGGHKWLMWPAGLGFAYISPRIFPRVRPAQAGWLSVETPYDFFNYDQPLAPDARRFETGSFNTTGIVAALATTDMMLEIGTGNIQQKVLENTDYLIRRLTEKGYRLYTDPAKEHRSGIVSFFHEKAEPLAAYLREQGIIISLRDGKIRVAPHFYNNKADLDRFLQALSTFS